MAAAILDTVGRLLRPLEVLRDQAVEAPAEIPGVQRAVCHSAVQFGTGLRVHGLAWLERGKYVFVLALVDS